MKAAAVGALLCALLMAPAPAENPEQSALLVAGRRHQVHLIPAGGGRAVDSFDLGFEEKARGMCVDATRQRLYLSAGADVIGYDLAARQVLWRTTLDARPADRLELSPDGSRLFVPSGFALGPGSLFILRAADGQLVGTPQREGVPGRAHNALLSHHGRTLWLSGRASPWLSEFRVEGDAVQPVRQLGPCASSIRPFVVGPRVIYAEADGLSGFQVLSRESGRVVATIATPPADTPAHPTHHECPCHGVGLSPDGRELWLVDSEHDRLVVFGASDAACPTLGVIGVGNDPGWINFSPDGRYVYPSTGEVIDRHSRRVVGSLQDAAGRVVASEKIVPVRLQGRSFRWAGRQWGLPAP